jgi:ubiquinol-cytochrome c reductase iron-sulfur subunit
MSSEDYNTDKGRSLDRRDILYIGTATFALAGVARGIVWPLIDNLNPSADVLAAMGNTEVDLAGLLGGQRVTVKWQGKPVFVCRRTAVEIAAAQQAVLSDLKDPETDLARVVKVEWLIAVGICTHLGCIPVGQKPSQRRGDWEGWFCPCHGSHYDTSGRIRKGPAPRNLDIPPYRFLTESIVEIGSNQIA